MGLGFGVDVTSCNSLRIIACALRTFFTAEQRLIYAAGATLDRQLLVQANEYGRRLQSKVLGTFVFVFFAVLVRSTFSVMYASAQALQLDDDDCDSWMRAAAGGGEGGECADAAGAGSIV